jgi:hypothetical protein
VLREEAEREAERRNHEHPDRGRYEFYALDESAGLSEDAWDVGARLREGPAPTAEWPGIGPQTPAGGAPPPEAAPAEEPLFLEGPTVAETDPFAGPDPFVEPLPHEGTLPHEEPVEHDGRPGLFVRGVGAAVILAGTLWVVMVVVLAVTLKPDEFTSFAAFVVSGVLGVLAILLGVAIRRS